MNPNTPSPMSSADPSPGGHAVTAAAAWRDLPSSHKGHSPAVVGPFVYMLYAAEVDRVKIGHARAPYKRLAEIEVGSPCALYLAAVFARSTREAEREMHGTYHQHRYRGEWFNRGRDIIEHATGRLLCTFGPVAVDGQRIYRIPNPDCLVTG